MSADSQLIVRDSRAISQPPGQVAALPVDREAALMQVIARAAADPSVDIDRMERLFVMQREMAAQRAEREFAEAMAQFKTHAPRIHKDKAVGYTNKDGSFTGYRHATLGAVCDAAIAGLGAVGISHRWDLEQGQNGRITVRCVLTHKGGHSVSTSLSGAPDDSGKKNAIQQTASTVTYLQRYTLLAATGLATDEQDDDGRGAGKVPEAERQAPPAPTGFEEWKADLIASADNGVEAMKAVWSPEKYAAFRTYANTWFAVEVAKLKDIARSVQS